MGEVKIDGVVLRAAKVIENDKGNIIKFIDIDSSTYEGFGELYFSRIVKKAVKGWKRHNELRLNIFVPVGVIRFVLFDDRPESATKGCFNDLRISSCSNLHLSLPPGIWMAFQGLSEENMLVNLISHKHNPTESDNTDLSGIEFDWTL